MYKRQVNVQTGEVVITTTVEKTIVSTSTGSDVFKYFDADTMLVEIEAGYAKNEPVTFAVRKAIEKGVVDLIHLGAQKELWKFRVEVPQIKDYIEIGNDVHNDMKIKETLEQKINENKKETKVLTETEKELVKEADNKDWENVDKENTDENNDNDTGDSSGNND